MNIANERFKNKVLAEARKFKSQFSARSIARNMRHPILFRPLVEAALKQLMREGKVNPGYVGMYRIAHR